MKENILETLEKDLELQSNEEYAKAVEIFLNAESNEEETEEAKKTLFQIISEKVKETEFEEKTKNSENLQLLKSLIETMEKSDFTDQQFYNLLYMINSITNILDIDYLIELAKQTSSSLAEKLLEEYKKNGNLDNITKSLEEITESIKNKALIKRNQLKIEIPNNISKLLDTMTELFPKVKETVNNGEKTDYTRVIKKYAKLCSKTNTKIEKELKAKNKVVVKITSAFKKLNPFKNKFNLKRKAQKGKIVKKAAIVITGVIVVVVGSKIGSFLDWKFSEKPNKEKDYPDTPSSSVTAKIDYQTVMSLTAQLAKLHTLANDVIEIEEEEKAETNNKEVNSNTSTSATEVESSIEEPTLKTESSSIPDEVPISTQKPSPTPAHTPAPVESTEEPTQTPIPGLDDATIALINNAATNTYNNWSTITDSYSFETIVDLTKCLNGYESEMTVETADSILLDMANKAAVPGANNAINKEQIHATSKIDFSNLLIKNQEGLSAVTAMQSYLNSALTDMNNLAIYAERALTQEAIIIEIGNISGDLGINSGDPAARLLWSRLAYATNAIIGVLGDDFSVTLNGVTYSQKTLNDGSLYEAMANVAKQELGNQKQK